MAGRTPDSASATEKVPAAALPKQSGRGCEIEFGKIAGYGINNTPPATAAACAVAPRTLTGIGGTI